MGFTPKLSGDTMSGLEDELGKPTVETDRFKCWMVDKKDDESVEMMKMGAQMTIDMLREKPWEIRVYNMIGGGDAKIVSKINKETQRISAYLKITGGSGRILMNLGTENLKEQEYNELVKKTEYLLGTPMIELPNIKEVIASMLECNVKVDLEFLRKPLADINNVMVTSFSDMSDSEIWAKMGLPGELIERMMKEDAEDGQDDDGLE